MPVFYARLAFDYLPFSHSLAWFTAFLVVANALCNKKNLAARMNVPVQLRTGGKSGCGDAVREDSIRLAQFAEPYRAGVVVNGRYLSFRKNGGFLGERWSGQRQRKQ